MRISAAKARTSGPSSTIRTAASWLTLVPGDVIALDLPADPLPCWSTRHLSLPLDRAGGPGGGPRGAAARKLDEARRQCGARSRPDGRHPALNRRGRITLSTARPDRGDPNTQA